MTLALAIGAAGVGVACSRTPLVAVPPAPQPPGNDVAGTKGAVKPPSAAVFELPKGIIPTSYWVLGPLPRLHPEASPRQSLDHDYLSALGGEAQARIASGTRLAHGAQTLTSQQVANESGVVEFTEILSRAAPPTDSTDPDGEPPTNDKVAYAYTEISVDAAQEATVLFGSDDAAKVWVNGMPVHRIAADRALDPESDRFTVPLVPGANRILVKVDNGHGGWGFGLRLFTAREAEQLEAVRRRRALDFGPRPVPESYLLDRSFPSIVVTDGKAYEQAFGSQPLSVRWFGPDLSEVTQPSAEGRYVALLEATTLDGFRYRHMLSFAKVAPSTIPWFGAPPFREYPAVQLPPQLQASEAVRAELSRGIWAGGVRSLWHEESSAIVAAALRELELASKATQPSGASKPPKPLSERESGLPLPAWLTGGFVANQAHQLALRMRLEERRPKPLAPPLLLQEKAGELKPGSEVQAGMKPGSVAKLRAIAKQWAAADPHGFVVLVARKGVVFLHEGYNGFDKSTGFYPASIAKTLAGLMFARAVDQGLLSFDQPLHTVFPDWQAAPTRDITFRHCFYHAIGLTGHVSHGGLYNAYLDQALLVQDAVFQEHGKQFVYGGDELNLAGKALELTTGQSIFPMLYESLQRPFAEPVAQFDLGAGTDFTALYLAKVGQMLMQDGAYGGFRFYEPGFVQTLWPEPIHRYAPKFQDKEQESGIGLVWMIDPPGPPSQGALGPNVVGHGAASGVLWRIAKDHELVIVVGRNGFANGAHHEGWSTRFVQAVAAGLEPQISPPSGTRPARYGGPPP